MRGVTQRLVTKNRRSFLNCFESIETRKQTLLDRFVDSSWNNRCWQAYDAFRCTRGKPSRVRRRVSTLILPDINHGRNADQLWPSSFFFYHREKSPFILCSLLISITVFALISRCIGTHVSTCDLINPTRGHYTRTEGLIWKHILNLCRWFSSSFRNLRWLDYAPWVIGYVRSSIWWNARVRKYVYSVGLFRCWY